MNTRPFRSLLAAILVVGLVPFASARPLPLRRGHAPSSPIWDVMRRIERILPRTRAIGDQVGGMQADVTLAFGNPAFQAVVNLTVTAGPGGLSELYFYLYQDDLVQGATIDGLPVTPQSYQGTVMLSGLDLAPGPHTLGLSLGGALPCDSGSLMGDVCSFSTDTRYFFMLGWVVPVFFDDVAYAFPKGTITVHLPAEAAGMTVVSDGTLVDESGGAQGPVATFDYSSDMSTYAVFVGRYQSFEGAWEDVPVRCVLSEAHAGSGPDCLDLATDVVQFHSDRYGKYGHGTLQIIDAGPIVAGGYGAPANVILNGQVFDYFDWSFIPVVAHEIGHQWWGSWVTFTGDSSIPLTEGLAELSSCAYQEDRLGDTHCLAREGAAYQAGVPAAEDLPLSSPQVTYEGGSEVALLLIYDKAPVVMDHIRRALGDEAFFGVLGDLTAAGPTTLTADDLWAAFADRTSPAAVDAWVTPWFEQAGYPIVTLATGYDDTGAPVLRATQAAGPPFGVLLPVAYDVGDQAVTHELRLDRAAQASGVLPDLTALPASVEVNAGRTALLGQVPSPTGDADHDGWVSGFDLLLMARAYGMTAFDAMYQAGNPFYTDACDTNADGTIDASDLTALEAGFGKEAGTP